MAQGHLGSQIGEPLAQHQARTGMGEILVNDLDALRRPAQLQGALAQAVLAVGGLAVDGDLCRRRLSNIDVGPSLEMGRLHFGIIAHEFLWELTVVRG